MKLKHYLNRNTAAGQEKANGLGKLMAAHAIARPSTAALALLPKG